MKSYFITPGLRFIAQGIREAAPFGTVHFGVYLSLGNMTGGITILTTRSSIDLLSLVIY